MRQQFYIFVECRIGSALAVAEAIKAMPLNLYAEVALISGFWDVLVRVEIDIDENISQILVERVQALHEVVRTRTEVGYPIYDPADVFF